MGMTADRRAKGSTRGRGWFRRLYAVACWLAVSSVLLAWLLIGLAGDASWVTTAMLYGPRWVWLIAPAILLLIAIPLRSPLAWPLGIAVATTLWPIMGFHFGLQRPSEASSRSAGVLRLMSCNVAGTAVQWDRLYETIASEQPDVVLLQECPAAEQLRSRFPQIDWNCQNAGSLFIASRYPIVESMDIKNDEGWRSIASLHRLATPGGLLWVVNVHLDTPRRGLEALRKGHVRSAAQMIDADTARRRNESAKVREKIRSLGGQAIVAGDFNLVVESRIYRDHWSDWINAFGKAGSGYGYTKWTAAWGARIDHVLVPPDAEVSACHIGDDLGSDHRPVLTTLRITPLP